MKRLLALALMIAAAASLWAQEVSDKKEIAVFSLGYGGWSIPAGALDMVDRQIVNVFTGSGRFSVVGLNLRLETGDIDEFMARVEAVKTATAAVDEKFRIGEETFTEADFRKIAGSYLAVIPSVVYYKSTYKDDTRSWDVEIHTAFTIISAEDSTAVAAFTVETYGSGPGQQDAVLDACNAIAVQLDYRLRSIDEFRLKSGIIEVLPGGRVIMELGSEMGILPGDEFSVVSSRLISGGRTVQENTGLIVINDVKSGLSYGNVVYSRGGVFAGDQLAEIPRIGADLSVYGRLTLSDQGVTGGAAGLRNSLSRGVYGARPFLSIEVPITSGTLNSIWPGFPVSMYFGGELLWYLGRLQIVPSISAGGTGLVPLNDQSSFILSHIGINGALAINWLLDDSIRIQLEGGYGYSHSIAPDWVPGVSSFGGLFAGAGVTFKI